MTNAKENGLSLAASLMRAQSCLSPRPAFSLDKLQRLELLLGTARDTLARGEKLSPGQLHGLNGALDDLRP